MFASLSLLFLATAVLSIPSTRSMPNITCTTIFNGPLAYSFVANATTQVGQGSEHFGTYTDGHKVFVDLDNQNPAAGEIFLFKECSSNYMGYSSTPPIAEYGIVVQNSTGLCLKVHSVTNDVNARLGKCSEVDDESQILQFWAFEGPPSFQYVPYALHFLGEPRSSSTGIWGMDFRAIPPPANETTFRAKLTNETGNGNELYLVAGPTSARN